MDRNSTEELARQVGDALGAAFPDSVTTQAQAQDQAQPQSQPSQTNTAATNSAAQKASCVDCNCHISASLTTKLRKGFACPACTANAFITVIKQVQQRLADRGGAFASKEKGMGHKIIRQDWRRAKMCLANHVAEWEALTGDERVLLEDLTNIKKALTIWENDKIAISKIPGLRYAEGAEQGEPTEEEYEVARLMIKLLRLLIEKEMRADDREAHGNSRKGEHAGTTYDELSSSSSLHQQHANLNGVPARSATVASSSPQTPPALGTLKSILKRKASVELPETSPQKRTRIANVVTVSPPRLNISNPSPFINLSVTITTQTHAKHTSPQQQRNERSFKRSAPNYAPGVWASGAFEEKARTSNFKSSWVNTEKHVAKELKEAEEEQTVFRGIKAVAGTWMGVWWVRKVTRHIDLNQLQAKLGKK